MKKRFWKKAAFALCLIGLLNCAAGCGNDKETDAEPTAVVTAAPEAEPETPEEESDEPMAGVTEEPEEEPTKETEPEGEMPETPEEESDEPMAGVTEEPEEEPTKETEPEGEEREMPETEPTPEGEAPGEKENGVMRDITTMELVREMGIGINLGNTFESCGNWINSSSVKNYETGWGSPVITKEMIEGYAREGFGVLRIPVAWSNMMGEDYTIHPDYLARVREVADWALDSGMYVILNIHWDSGWWERFPSEKEECMYKYVRIWTQLSEYFGDCGDYLMFESLNEEGCWNDVWNRWGGTSGKAEAYGLLNEINQTFVDTVRASGGNNAARHLLIAGYATDIDLTCDAYFEMPEDAAGRCAVSVHYYTPSTFCILEADADWGRAKTDWGSDADVKELNSNMEKLKKTFVDQGIPVIMGEYGVALKNKDMETVRLFLSSVCEAAYTRGICPVLWDTTGNFYDRNAACMKDDVLMEELLSVLR